MKRNIATPHEIRVYEVSVDGLVKKHIATLTFYTENRENTPPDWRNQLRVEVDE